MNNRFTNTIYMVSKLSFQVLAILFITLDLALANETVAQVKSIKEVTISLSMTEAKLSEVLEEIERKTNYRFSLSSSKIDLSSTSNIHVVDATVEDVLMELSKEMSLKFGQINNSISVSKRKRRADEPRVSVAIKQGPTIKGTVTDENGSGLPGSTIQEKGTSNGTITDVDGNYSITVSDEDAVLAISFVGYVAVEIPVTGKSTIDVSLEPDIEALQEVVVVGYGTQKKETVTGSVASVKGDELEKVPSVNLSNAMAGRLPGVFATQSSGEPGYDGSAIRIRGSNTLGNTDALVVIDGVPGRAGGLDRLNALDIESISVLKDASAAIYGSRAANGVILITTKRGTTGKPKFSYSFNQAWAQPAKIPELLNAAQYAEARNELKLYGEPVANWDTEWNNYANGADPGWVDFTHEDIRLYRDGSDPWGHPDSDWYGETMKNWAPQNRHNLQVNGGTDAIKYLVSLGYQNQDGYYKNSATGYKQYDLRMNLDAKFNEYISMDVGFVGRNEDRFFPTVGAGDIFRMLMRGKPTDPAYWPNGLPGPDIENGQNPVTVTTNATGYHKDKRYYLQSNGNLNIKIPGVEGLNLKFTGAVDQYLRKQKRWNTPFYLYTWDGTSYESDGTTPLLVAGIRGGGNGFQPELDEDYEDQLDINLLSIASYDRSFGDHTIGVMAGIQRETIEHSNFGAHRRYYLSSAIDQIFAGSDDEKNNEGSAWERARLSYFGRVNYNFSEKYLLEFLWRYDGSYNFPEDTRYGFFPGILAGWTISEESFWQSSIGFIDYLKIRGSYGQMGNDQIWYNGNYLEYQYYATYGFDTFILDGGLAKSLYETRVPNNQITWEIANNLNFGLEGDILDGMFNFELDYFINTRTQIPWVKNASVPQTTGLSLPAENIGELENKGWEFLFGFNQQSGEFDYSVSVNGGYAKNKILFWDEPAGAPEWQRSTGHPINTGLYYLSDGVFTSMEDVNSETLDYSELTNTLRPGDIKYQDTDGNGIINGDDRVRIDKNNVPTFQGGLSGRVQWKNIDMSVLFQGSAGAQIWVKTESGEIGNFTLQRFENRWSPDNPSSEHPRLDNRGDQYWSGENDYFLRSTDYLRLKNLEIGYTFSPDLISAIGLSNVRVYVNGLNLITWDKLDVYDPEATNSQGRYYPQARVMSVGANISF